MDVRTNEEFITVGIDPHKNTVVAFFFNVTTKEKWTYRFPATPLAITAFAQNCLKRNMLVGIEEGPNAYAIASILKEYVDRLLIICREKRSGKVKTDEIDAEEIAIALATSTYKSRWIPPLALERLRRLIHSRDSIARKVAGQKNRIRSFLAQELIRLEANDPFSKKGIAEMKQLAYKSLPMDKGLNLLIEVVIYEFLSHILRMFDDFLRSLGKDNPVVQTLISMPGIDVIAAVYLIAEMGDPSRFPSPKKLAKYAGLVPSLYQSGERSRNGRITKAGRKLLRWIMVQIANNAVRFPGHIQEFFLRLKAKKGYAVAIVATARKLLCAIWHMLTKNELYRDYVARLYKKKLRALERTKKVELPKAPNLEMLFKEIEKFLKERGIVWKAEEGLMFGLIEHIIDWEMLLPKNLYP